MSATGLTGSSVWRGLQRIRLGRYRVGWSGGPGAVFGGMRSVRFPAPASAAFVSNRYLRTVALNEFIPTVLGWLKSRLRPHCLYLLMLVVQAGCYGRPSGEGYPSAKWIPRETRFGSEKGRHGKRIDLIILYTTEHTADRAMQLWGESPNRSGHYIVTKTGEVWQFLQESDAG